MRTHPNQERYAACVSRLRTARSRIAASWRNATSNPPDRTNLDNPDRVRYLKSYLLLRVLIGAIGLSLPLMTWLFSALLPAGHWALRGAISDYYYSGMREYFTCSLAVIALFLIAYKLFQRGLENYVTLVAGFAALVVAFFPTNPPDGYIPPANSVQAAFGTTPVANIHGYSAMLFVVSLALVSYFFGEREGKRAPRPGHRSPAFWRRLHHGCTIAMGAACVFFGARNFFHLSYGSLINAHYTWVTELVALVAFATSWLAKGAEITQLPRGCSRLA